MPVGDVTSKEAGTGARYNDDKMPMHQIPVRYWAAVWEKQFFGRDDDELLHVVNAATDLAAFQAGDNGALRDTLISPCRLREAMAVFHYGQTKYALYNWAKGMAWSIPIGSALRHLQAIVDGEELDPESGLPHIGHVYCNLIMLDWFVDHYPEGDDRPYARPHETP